MGDAEKKEIETLNELKEKLWLKIQILDGKLKAIDESSEDYRKAMDAYHKIVKSYVDIIKVQRYAPGALSQDPKDDSLAKLLTKLKTRQELASADKVALQEFKEFLDNAGKVPLGLRKKKNR